MNARRDEATLLSALAADPLAGVSLDRGAIADLAFGSFSRSRVEGSIGRHLALLTSDSLELDLSDPAQRQFGDYELKELIGEGGMGVVYRARQHSLDRDVAVKLLAAGPWASREFVERFQREAQNAARMQHPNIVAIYEVGTAEELHFFSMRLICGGSLSGLLKREGRLSAVRAAQLLRVVAEAVDYAHRLGVLHLDLKPANVLLDDNGNPHVADFGLARRFDSVLATDNDEISGTPSYMAPEQAIRGAQKITPATDIWGLGAILYELVAGRPPYLGSSPQDTLKQLIESALTSPREFAPDLPRDLEAIILKCMASEVTRRYASGRALADDLSAFLDGRQVGARPLNAAQRIARWGRREPKLASMAAIALATLLIGLAATTQQWKRAEHNSVQAEQQTLLARSNAAASSERLWDSRREAALRLQSDGKAFDALPALIANIEEQEKLARPADIERREVGMILHQGVTLIDRMIIADATPITAALSPDGSLLAVGLNDVSVRWYDTATLTERGRVDLSDLPTSDGAARTPVLLRFVDNHRLRVTLEWYTYVINPSSSDTFLVDLDTARAITPPGKLHDVTQTNFSEDGRYALVVGREGIGQFWQTEPWRVVSETKVHISGRASDTPWLIGRDGRFALHFRYSMTGITISDPKRALALTSIADLANRRFTAWQESHDGRHVALGDDQGHVFLLDIAAQHAQQLPTSTGSEVTWLAFSDDDAWFAAARHDGDAYGFDIRGNPLHSGQLQHDFELRYVAISHQNNLLIASGAGESALWRMPEQGPAGGGTDATRITANPSHAARAGLYWAGESMQAGLLVTADMDGEVRLWRLPVGDELNARAANAVPGELHFDGRRVADVEYDQVRVLAVDGAASSPWVKLPQPVLLAEIADAGKSVVVIVGAKLYVFDASTMQLRFAPTSLPGTPLNVTVDADGARVMAAFGMNQQGFREKIFGFDAATGQQRAGSATVRGPVRQFEFSPDGTQFLVNGPIDGATEVFDAATLHPLAAHAHDVENPTIWATFSDDQAKLWLLARSSDESSPPGGELLRWNMASGAIDERRVVQGTWPVGVRMVGAKPLLATSDNLELDPGGATPQSGPRLHGGEVTTLIAATRDKKLIAHAYGRNVQLYDTQDLQRVGPPLPVNWRIMDSILRLSFDDTGSLLLGRLGTSRRLLLWNVGADTRAVAALQRDAELLAPSPHGARLLSLAAPTQRHELHARDPGAWRVPSARPTFAVARYVDGSPVPQRDPGTSPLLLDLTKFYTLTPYTIRNAVDTVLTDTVTLPSGVAPIEGVDYDIRGAVELRQVTHEKSNPLAADLRAKVAGIAAPPVRVAALHVLILAALPVPESAERVYANVRLHYRDGSQALLPIRTQREVPGLTDHDRPTPVGWAMSDLAVIGVLRPQLFSNPRLPNPHPERIIASLDLETSTEGWSEPVFIAITAEPVIADTVSGRNEAH